MRLPRWLRRVLILLLLAIGAAGATVVARPTFRQPAPLRLPVEVRGRPGRLVTIQAETAADCAEARLVPRALVALTLQTYVFAVVNPVMVNGDAVPAFARVTPPFDDVHVAV